MLAEAPTRDREQNLTADAPWSSDQAFARRLLWVFVLLAAGAIAWSLYQAFVVTFGAVLLSLAIRAIADRLIRATRIPDVLTVSMIVLALASAVVAVGWLFGSQLRMQFNLLATDLPQNLSLLVRDLGSTSWGRWLLDQIKEADLSGPTGQIAGHVAALFGSVFRALACTAVLLFAVVYFAVQPRRYRDALLRLVPSDRRARTGEIVDLIGATLRRWIVGQSITMAVVGTSYRARALGIGIGAPLALGITMRIPGDATIGQT